MSSNHELSIQAMRGEEVILRVEVNLKTPIGDPDPVAVSLLTQALDPIITRLMDAALAILKVRELPETDMAGPVPVGQFGFDEMRTASFHISPKADHA